LLRCGIPHEFDNQLNQPDNPVYPDLGRISTLIICCAINYRVLFLVLLDFTDEYELLQQLWILATKSYLSAWDV
jgi:hypothetical protein